MKFPGLLTSSSPASLSSSGDFEIGSSRTQDTHQPLIIRDASDLKAAHARELMSAPTFPIPYGGSFCGLSQ